MTLHSTYRLPKLSARIQSSRLSKVNPITDKRREDLKRLAAIRRRWWKEAKESGKRILCGICHLPILSFRDLDSEHIEPGKMGGCKNHDESNLQPAHKRCNFGKGSKRTGWKKGAAA